MSKSAVQPTEPLAHGDERNTEERLPSASVTQLNRHPAPPVVIDSGGNSKKIAISVLLLALIGATAAFFVHQGKSRAIADAAAAKAAVVQPLELASVDVEIAQPRTLTRSLPMSGSIGPLVQATVKAKVGGEVKEISVFEGQDVAAGDVIARIDARNLRAQYDREMAAVEKARADLDLAKLNRDKNKTLLEQRYISQNTFESSESTYAGSVASLKLAEAQARVAQISLWDSVVRAPFDGIVAKRTVQQGEKVSPDSPMVTLVDLREMLLEAAIPAADIPAVKVGQSARFKVNGFTERQFEGTVQRINPATSENSRSIMVYIAVPNPDRALKGGMFAQGQLLLGTGQPTLAVPRTAVRAESGVSVVYTLDKGKIGRRQVTTGAVNEDSGYIEISNGLQAGEQVIIADIGDRKAGDAAIVRGQATQSAR